VANPNPTNISREFWAFWLRFKALEKTAKLGGIYAGKAGYHNARRNLSGSDYSVGQYALDRKGSSSYAAAIDLTLPLAQMKKYSTRLMKSGCDPKDPRGNYLREFYGNVDGNGYVDGWDFQSCTRVSSDSSHLWHIHISVLRAYTNDPAAFRALFSILRGESVTAWRVKEWALKVRSKFAGKPPASKPPVVKATKVYHTVKAGQTLLGIAKAYKITYATLQKLNPQKKGHWDSLAIGEKIRVK